MYKRLRLTIALLSFCLLAGGLWAADAPDTSIVRLQLKFQPGWNLFSLPLAPVATDPDEFFDGLKMGPVWGTSPDNYQQVSALAAYEAYWVFCARSKTLVRSFEPNTARSAAVTRTYGPGWHMIGVAQPMTALELGEMAVWSFNRTVYVTVEKLLPGQGYFLNLDAEATVNLGTFTFDGEPDGMSDAWEQMWDLKVGTDDSALDYDKDNLSNLLEYQHQTSPWDRDSDDDILTDHAEVTIHGTDPLDINDPSPLLRLFTALKEPIRISAKPDGGFLASDTNQNSVFILNEQLQATGQLKNLDKPLGVAGDAAGNMYVGSDGKDRVEVYDSYGKLTRTIGEGVVKMPNGLLFDLDGNLYVVDSRSNCVHVYNAAGEPVRRIGENVLIWPASAVIRYPTPGSMEGAELIVADQKNFFVRVFDLQGNELRLFGGSPTRGFGFRGSDRGEKRGGLSWGDYDMEGRFVMLQAVALAPDGNLHVLDCYQNRIQVMNPATGAYISTYGGFGTDPGQMKLPLDLRVLPNGQVVVANAGNKRVEVIHTISRR